MTNNQITFNDLPQVVAELRDEVSGMKALLLNLQNRPTQQRENRHRPVTPEQVAEYTNIPLATIYQKLANREIPGSKPGKRWVIYLDEIDKWLEANRKNPIPLTDEEQNAAILASHNSQLIVTFAKEAGDLNNDGKMDITDVVSLVNLILGQ